MSQSQHIIIVDDEAPAREMVGDYLKMHGFMVTLCDGGKSLRGAIEAGSMPDLVVLDLNMPEEDGLSIIRDLKSRTNVPVIMLTATASPIDRVVGLELGADDFVPKPFNPRELVARIRAVLRRGAGGRAGFDLVVGDLHLNAAARSVRCAGRALDLTTAEFNLLEHLLRNAGQIVTRDDLSAAAFARQQSSRIDRNVDTLVSKVRRKLDPAGDLERRIKTVRNVGYLLALPLD
jgi:two-component system, OmpR family, response regulator